MKYGRKLRLANRVRAFLAETCTNDLESEIGSTELFKAWQTWCRHTQNDPGSHRAFSITIAEITQALEWKVQKEHTRNGQAWLGLYCRDLPA